MSLTTSTMKKCAGGTHSSQGIEAVWEILIKFSQMSEAFRHRILASKNPQIPRWLRLLVSRKKRKYQRLRCCNRPPQPFVYVSGDLLPSLHTD